MADIDLRFRASTDQDVRKLVLDYELQILPILMKFEPHVQTEFPLEAVDPIAVAQWFDDRIVDFVRTFVSLHQNELYLKDHMVVDPVAGVRFPRFAAASVISDGRSVGHLPVADNLPSLCDLPRTRRRPTDRKRQNA